LLGYYWDKRLQCCPTDFKDYRPIVVANFKFKIISKILADRLALVAARIISPNQYGFVQGRKI